MALPSSAPANGRLDPEGLRVSNDGRSVYVAGGDGPAVYQFPRAPGRAPRRRRLDDAGAVAQLHGTVDDDALAGAFHDARAPPAWTMPFVTARVDQPDVEHRVDQAAPDRHRVAGQPGTASGTQHATPVPAREPRVARHPEAAVDARQLGGAAGPEGPLADGRVALVGGVAQIDDHPAVGRPDVALVRQRVAVVADLRQALDGL